MVRPNHCKESAARCLAGSLARCSSLAGTKAPACPSCNSLTDPQLRGHVAFLTKEIISKVATQASGRIAENFTGGGVSTYLPPLPYANALHSIIPNSPCLYTLNHFDFRGGAGLYLSGMGESRTQWVPQVIQNRQLWVDYILRLQHITISPEN